MRIKLDKKRLHYYFWSINMQEINDEKNNNNENLKMKTNIYMEKIDIIMNNNYIKTK